MMILKIMSGQDLPDSDPGKEFKLVSDVLNVSFIRDKATECEARLLGYKNEGRRRFCTIKMPGGCLEDWVHWDMRNSYLKNGGEIIADWHQKHPGGNWPTRKALLTGMRPKSNTNLIASFARCSIADLGLPGGRREETFLLTGNCYVLNDRGKTIESFWARRNHKGEQVGEQ